MSNARDSGVYWVKIKSTGGGLSIWTIAMYYSLKDYWMVIGSEDVVDDDYFEEVNETRLIEPDK